MSLFRRDAGSPVNDRSAPRPPESGAEAASSAAGHVAAGSRVEGTITGGADWVIDGELAGGMAIDGRVTVGSAGRVAGSVRARSIRLAGHVEGDLTAVERVEVVATGHLTGNISAPRVIIAEGAYFKGSVQMAGGDRAAGPAPKAGAKERKS
jgi:cytoskeletal protein CcmA (bactofilin family)